MDNIITEIGYILIGGAVAFVPVYLLGIVLQNGVENDTQKTHNY